jgi:hypothetical protein
VTMKFSAVFVALAATIVPVLSAPAAEVAVEARDELEKRDLSVYVCETA